VAILRGLILLAARVADHVKTILTIVGHEIEMLALSLSDYLFNMRKSAARAQLPDKLSRLICFH